MKKPTVLVGFLALSSSAFAEYTIAEGKNVLKIAGQLGTSFDMGRKQDFSSNYGNLTDNQFSSVAVNTANISFSGAIEERFVFKMRMKMAPEKSQDVTRSTYGMIDYALAGYTFLPELTVIMGKVDVGGGFDYQSSSMSPLTFAQDVDWFFGSGSANGVKAFGTVLGMIDWSVTAVNRFDLPQDSKYDSANDNRSMDYVATLAFHPVDSKNVADAEGYNAEGGFKHFVAVDYAQLDNGKNPHRKIAAMSGFFSFNNMIAHLGATTESTKNRHDDFWTVGAGYLWNKTWRPGVSVSSLRSETLNAVKGKHTVCAVNLTQFHDNNRWRNYIEFQTTAKSDEAKAAIKALDLKDKTPWKLSLGLTLNI